MGPPQKGSERRLADDQTWACWTDFKQIRSNRLSLNRVENPVFICLSKEDAHWASSFWQNMSWWASNGRPPAAAFTRMALFLRQGRNFLNNSLLLQHPACKCPLAYLPGFDLLFIFYCLLPELLQFLLRRLDLFGRRILLFQPGDAVVPEQILPLVSRLVALPFGFVLKRPAGLLSAGRAAAGASQGAAGAGGKEHPAAVGAGVHQQPGIPDALAVVDEHRPQCVADNRTLKKNLALRVPNLQPCVR